MQNFFEKLNKLEAENILRKGIFEKCQLTIEGRPSQIVRIQLCTVEERTKLYILTLEVCELKDKICAFSFRLGTRIFFFKAKVHIDGRGFFVETTFDVLELRRRRHIRFEVFDNFIHECYVITSVNKNTRIDAKLINFSESGAKLVVNADLIFFQKGNGIILSIKVGKRAAFLIGCQIRFVSRKPKAYPELGVEFVNLTDIKRSRILNVCEDLSRMLIQARKNKRIQS